MARGGIVGECREKARSIVDGMPYDRLAPYPGDPSTDYLMLVLRHFHRYGEIVGGRRVVGFIKRHDVNNSDGYTMYAVLDDGCEVNWSISKACRAMNPNATTRDLRREDAIDAMRFAVKDQVLEKRINRSVGRMIVTDDLDVVEGKEVDAHHAGEEFRELVDDFLAERRIGLEDIRVVSIAGRPEIADEELRDAWRRFHAEHAHISLIPRDDHVREHGGS